MNLGGTFTKTQDSKEENTMTVTGRLDWRGLNKSQKFKVKQTNQFKTNVKRPYAQNDVFTMFWAFNSKLLLLPTLEEIGGNS